MHINERIKYMKAFFKKWWHGLLALYTFIYLPCFFYLEHHITEPEDFHSIHSVIDDYIPFVEHFIIPYYSWFIFMAIGIIYFFIRSQGECVRMGAALIIGMSIAVVIYFVYPSGLIGFRPEVFPRDNIFTEMVKGLHKADTPTNVLPSLHVYNTLVIECAVFESKTFGKHKKLVCTIAAVWGLLICVSTVFLKQHSIIDVFAAIILIAIIYPITYKTKFFKKL